MTNVIPETVHTLVHRAQNTLFCEQGKGTLCRDENGTLYAVVSGMRMQEVDPFGALCMYVSKDGGQKWSPPIVIRQSYSDDRDPSIVYLGNGRLMVSWMSFPATAYLGTMFQGIKNAASRNSTGPIMGMLSSYPYLPREQMSGGSFYMISDDYGMTWSEPVKMPFFSPFGPTRCQNGGLIFAGEECFSGDEQLKNTLGIYVSVDNGDNWEFVALMPELENKDMGISAPHIIELPNNRLFATVHANQGSLKDPSGNVVYHDHTLYTTYSDDYGKTWSDWRCLHVSGAPGHLLLHSTGALICTYDRHVAPFKKIALVSYDNGFSWAEEYTLAEDGDGGFDHVSTVEMPDGSLLTMYRGICDGDAFHSTVCTAWKLEPHPELAQNQQSAE
ncbi:MAG: exo-alpha-sialidase [Ruminococcaceae bacterium]|nr:exo-alpha-sialidase [Oscillospiraceae bacterium]